MNDAENGGGVNGAMKLLPALAAQAANPARSRSNRQRDEQHESRKADRNVAALGDVFPHRRKIEGLVGTDVGEEVQARVKKSEKAEHTTEADELREMEKFAERGDGQREDEKAQDPVTGGVLDELDGIGAQIGRASCRERV